MKKAFCMLLCCLLLCGCSAPDQEAGTVPTVLPENVASVPSTAPTTAALTTITVYVPNENFDGFDTVDITGENLTFSEAMVRSGVLPENIVIHSFSLEEDTLTVDFGSEFRDLINTQGSTGEYLIMGSIVNTLIAQNTVKYIRITVDGGILESGHVLYDFPMEFYE